MSASSRIARLLHARLAKSAVVSNFTNGASAGTQESMILAPQQAAAAGLRSQPAARELGRLVVLQSPVLADGETLTLDSHPLTVGRGSNNDVALDADEYASTRHARFEPRRDGVWVEDIGSTNGTFVNGIRLTRDRKLTPGDVVRIGETDLRFEL